jgi:lysozyme
VNYSALKDELIRDEGLRFKIYLDTVGKSTIGVGRNLSDVGISREEAMIMLDNDITAATTALDATFPWWRGMNDVRQNAIVNMAFNLGIHRLAGFKLALAAMEKGDYAEAANQMEHSEWYTQVGGRAIRLTEMMRSGS